MNILVVSSQVLTTPPAYYGGLELVAFTDAVRLAEMGHDVTLICKEGSADVAHVLYPQFRKVLEKINFFEIDRTVMSEKKAMEQFEKRFDVTSFDAIIDHGWEKPTIKYSEKVPTMLVVHGINPYEPGTNFGKALLAGVSKFHAEHLASYYLVPTVFVYYDHELEEPFLFHSVHEDRQGLLFLGRPEKAKGLAYFLRLCSQIKEPCYVVGDSILSRNYEELYSLYALATQLPNVVWKGMVPRDEVLWLLRRVKATFVYPTNEYKEVFGLWAFESFLVGTPVITSYNGAMQEYVEDYRNGCKIPESRFEEAVKCFEYLGGIPGSRREEIRAEALERFNSRRIVEAGLRTLLKFFEAS